MESFQNAYRGYKNYIVGHCIDVNRTVCFHPGVMSEQCRASSTVPTHWNKRSIQRGPLDGLSFSEFLCMATQAYNLNFFLQFIIFSSYCSCAFKLKSEYFYIQQLKCSVHFLLKKINMFYRMIVSQGQGQHISFTLLSNTPGVD